MKHFYSPEQHGTWKMTFKLILSNLDNPDKFTFITVEECVDMDDCINHVKDEFPDHQIESIRKEPLLR